MTAFPGFGREAVFLALSWWQGVIREAYVMMIIPQFGWIIYHPDYSLYLWGTYIEDNKMQAGGRSR